MDVELAAAAIDHLGARCESDWLARKGTKHRSNFLSQGYFTWDLPSHTAQGLRGFFSDEIRTVFSPSDHGQEYFPWRNNWHDSEVTLLNAENVYFACPRPDTVAIMEHFLDSIRDEIEQQLAYCWRIYNVRAWSVRPGGAFGPNAWHADGVSLYRRKLMFYLDPPNEYNGSIEFVDRNGNRRVLESEIAQCILFDSSILMHRARPPGSGVRPSIEVTMIPSIQTCTECVFAGHAALVPKQIDEKIGARLEASRYRDLKPHRSIVFRVLKGAERSAREIKKALKGTRAKETKAKEEIEAVKAHVAEMQQTFDMRNSQVCLNIGAALDF
jgi:hypothetical protein